MFDILLNIIAPVLITAGMGFYWAKSGRTFSTETVTGLVTNIGAPFLIFTTLDNLATIWRQSGYATDDLFWPP